MSGFLGPRFGTADGAVSDHGLLSGLADDDHAQYLLADGTRAMTGDLAMGTNDVNGVGFVSTGASPAATGAVRLSHTERVDARNQADSGNIRLVESAFINGRDAVILGNTGSSDVQIQGQSDCRLGFFGITPALRAVSTDDLKDMLTLHGLMPGTDATPLNLDGGTLRAGLVGVGAAPAASAALDVTSTTKGTLLPRMTTTQRDAISTPATGLMVFNTTTNQLEIYNGTAWVPVGGAGYALHWGANFAGGDAGKYAEAWAESNGSPQATLIHRSEIIIVVAGVMRCFGWHSAAADATTVFKVLVNAAVVETITTTGVKGTDGSASTAVAVGDVVAVEFDAGTAPTATQLALGIG